MSLTDAWQALADAVKTAIPGLSCTGYEPADPVAPALFPVLPEAGTYTAVIWPPTVDMAVTVRLLVAKLDGEVATGNLLPYLDPTGAQSVKAAIEDDKTLGGTVESATVTGWSSAGEITYPSASYLGVDFTVELLIS